MTKINKQGLFTLVSCAALTVAACGSSGVDSGVPGNKMGDEVSDDEAQMICEAGIDYLDTRVTDQQLCELMAGYAAAGIELQAGRTDDESIQTACREAADECVADPEAIEDVVPDSDSACAGQMGGLEDCAATVDEIEQCLQDSVDSFAAILDELPPCSELSMAELISLALDPPGADEETPESCQTVEEKCPDADVGFSMDGVSGGTGDGGVPTSDEHDDHDDGMGGAAN